MTVAPTGEHYLSREVLPGDPDPDAVAELVAAVRYDLAVNPNDKTSLVAARNKLRKALAKVEGSDE